jgi:hypothetical protein
MENSSMAKEFVTFCVSECGDELSWDNLYDQMCWTAGRRSYKGMGYRELAAIGVGLGINDLDGTYALAKEVAPFSF